jgi:AcrR family transcriptional regulator
VDTAIAIADAEGIEAVTVRRVAGEMGVAAMSLYTYVANKAELVELMVDAVYLEMAGQDLSDKNWRLRVEAMARDNLALYRRHPWMVAVYPERPPLGPGVISKYERELRALEGLGLSDVEMDSALTFLLNFVRAAAGDEIQSERLRAATAMTTGEWWAAHARALAALVSPEEFPTAVRVGAAAGAANEGAYNVAFAFEFGLQRVLDGLGRLVAAVSRQEGGLCA